MNNDLNLTLLGLGHIFEEPKLDENQLEILKKYGAAAAITDFAILLGGDVSSDYYINEKTTGKDRTGLWWTQHVEPIMYSRPSNSALDGKVFGIGFDGGMKLPRRDARNVGIRPAIKYSSIANIVSNEVIINKGEEIECGKYPQTIVDENYSRELESEYINENLKTTGKDYVTDSARCADININFVARIHTEYEYNGSKYIRFIGDSNCNGKILSDGRIVEMGEPYWVKVEPVVWLVDEKEDIALCKNIIASGVQFDNKEIYDGNFSKTTIKWFMDTYLSKDLINDLSKEQLSEENKILNPYGFDFAKLSDEDMLKGAIESGVAVYLHGLSGDGKSARVKEYDKDAEIIYLHNATPDAIIGKSVYKESTGEMIDIKPTWLVNLEEKCKKEPDRLHVLFFDEISNAPKSIQGLAFNIILNREVNGKWRLPENARVVAAGNDLNDSLAANQMEEPLFNRFAHIYIRTTLESWLKWASKNNIHPAIYAYIAYKGESVLRTEYDGKHPNANPRKWEMASKVLYQTKNPNMLKSLVGKGITNEFIMFCKQKVITLEEILNNNYEKEEVYYLDLAEKYATIMNLSQVGEENLECVRDFVSLMGKEILATFDSLWIHGDNERLEVIADLKSGNRLVRRKNE